MISNILPVMAFAGAAMAACPISVAITGATDHTVDTTVTNTGSETITIFTGNTVLAPENTLDVVVADASGAALPFEGAIVNYKRAGLAATSFKTLAPGETATSSVNVARTYKLAGVETATVTALQGFKFVTGTEAPSTLSEMDSEACTSVSSNSIAITPDQSVVADEHISKRNLQKRQPNSRIGKRSITYHSCTTAQTTSLQTSVADAISESSAAYTAAATALYYFTTWFKSTAQETKVRTIYNDVVGLQTTSPTISCTDTYNDCSSGEALLYTVPADNYIVPCPSNGYWSFPEYSTTCADFDYDRAGCILHEATHLFGTDDYAYGPTNAKLLSAAEASANADTYEMYAGSVRLKGCS